jgi:hypothetical protein
MMTTRNGPDVAFFTAVGEQLTVHMRRYEKFQNAPDKTIFGKDWERKAIFDERAIYFFYGMFRVARTDFLATKGYVLYPRIWMEEAFARITDSVIKDYMCCEEDAPKASPIEQAALYHYFGASKAMYHAGSKAADEPLPDLFQFSQMLDDAGKPGAPAYVVELSKGFQDFENRLRSGCIDRREIITSFEAIVGLDDYAFNTLFSEWYQQFRANPPTTQLPSEPPLEFLPYTLDTFESESDIPDQKKKEWCEERQRAWQIILDNCPNEFKQNGDANICR